MKKNPLTIASEMIDQFGEHAELLAADRMDSAMLAEDAEGFEEWSLVAKAIALLSRHNEPVPAASPKPAPKAAADCPDNIVISTLKQARI